MGTTTITSIESPAATPPTTTAPPASEAPLVDRQRRTIDYLRVSVTDRCNYRCTYCLPEEGVAHAARQDILTFEEIARLVSCFTRLGVRRVRLTGGEPTVRRDLPDLVVMLRRIAGLEEVSLSTNGHLMVALAEPLRRAGVDRLNISIDSLDPQRFRQITRGGDLARVLAGIEAARVAGYASIKLNTVAVRGFNEDELPGLCDYSWQRGLVPRFIEQMPMAEGALFVPGSLMGAADIRACITAAFPEGRFVPEQATRALGAGPARYWRADADADAVSSASANPYRQRRFGIISAMTEHFCDSCNRVRLSAAGALHTCLAHDDVTDLRAVLRDGGEQAVLESIRAAVAVKRDGHNFGLLGIGGPRKAMIQIGG